MRFEGTIFYFLGLGYALKRLLHYADMLMDHHLLKFIVYQLDNKMVFCSSLCHILTQYRRLQPFSDCWFFLTR